MSGQIIRGGKPVRPSFNFRGGDSFDSAAIAAQMLESIRNILEDIQKSQMLQCDVRQMISELRYNSERTRKAIERIDRRLAKAEKLR